jgi:hypothetical protein
MKDTPGLYDTLVEVLCQHEKWLDVRHAKTLAWMMVGLIESSLIGLAAWVPYVQSRAQYAQSTVRRFRRWLNNGKIAVHDLYGPLIQQALAEWGEHRLYLALDSSLLWDQYCIVRISVVFRGRAVPLVWQVLAHGSSAVSYATYQELLDKAALLLPVGCQVVFLADRGFADTDLMRHLQRLGWHWRIRIKSNFWIYRRHHARCQPNGLGLAPGQACFWHRVWLTAQRFGPLHVALARLNNGTETWYIVSDELTGVETFDEYGRRFNIEENFLDDKSNGFQLESSLIRSADALSRLCFVLAMATLFLVAQGVEVVAQGKRRWVDPHWFRGASYLKIGWSWVKKALHNHWPLLTHLALPGEPDPEPAIASRKQFLDHHGPHFSVEFVR